MFVSALASPEAVFLPTARVFNDALDIILSCPSGLVAGAGSAGGTGRASPDGPEEPEETEEP